MDAYYIFICDEEGKYTVPIAEKGQVKCFDCIYAAELYAKQVGLKSGYIIRR